MSSLSSRFSPLSSLLPHPSTFISLLHPHQLGLTPIFIFSPPIPHHDTSTGPVGLPSSSPSARPSLPPSAPDRRASAPLPSRSASKLEPWPPPHPALASPPPAPAEDSRRE
jgi:hypothetical protein